MSKTCWHPNRRISEQQVGPDKVRVLTCFECFAETVYRPCKGCGEMTDKQDQWDEKYALPKS